MAKNKTTETDNSVALYLANIADEKKRADCSEIIHRITQETGLEPKMWGTGIVGFGSYHYVYDSGHEGNAPLAGVAASAISLYLTPDLEKKGILLQKLGKHKAGKGCIYIKNIQDVDMGVLLELVNSSIDFLKNKY